MKHEEDDLQISCFQFFAMFPYLLCYHVKNSGSKSIQSAVRDKKLGVKSGIADIVVEWEGGHGYIELKTKTGELSPSQIDFRDTCLKWKKNWAICRSFEEVKETLVRWGAISL